MLSLFWNEKSFFPAHLPAKIIFFIIFFAGRGAGKIVFLGEKMKEIGRKKRKMLRFPAEKEIYGENWKTDLPFAGGGSGDAFAFLEIKINIKQKI